MTDSLRALLRPELAELRAYDTPHAPAAIRLDANESPWPLPDAAKAQLGVELAALPLHRYPDPRATALREALAAHVDAHPDELVLGVGSDELIALLETALARPRDGRAEASVLAPSPSFSMYGLIARGRGVRAVTAPLAPDFALDVEAMRRVIAAERPNLVFLASPNNPTGNAFEEAALRAVVEAASDAIVVIDEAYGAFAERAPGAALYDAYENVVLMGTLSKIGMAALRVGWVRARPWLAQELEKVRLPYNLPAPSQHLATALLGPLAPWVAERIATIRTDRGYLEAGLHALPGLAPLPSDANFVLVRVEAGEQAASALAQALHAAGIQVRAYPGHPRLASHLRITVGTRSELDALFAALRTALAVG